MNELIETPYGRKTPELLCKAMDAYELLRKLIDESDKNGVSSLYENREGNPYKQVDTFGELLQKARKIFEKEPT